MLKKYSPSIIILVGALLLLLIPVWYTVPWRNLILSSRFKIPVEPKVVVMKAEENQMINQVVHPYVFTSGESTLENMLKLRHLGWPAYLEKNELKIGPFLDQREKDIYKQELTEITHHGVSVVDFDITD